MDVIIDNVSKASGEDIFLDGISLKATRGNVVGILGPVQAGKSLLIQSLVGIAKPDSGAITFDEKPLNGKIRNRIGYLPEKRGIYQKQRLIDVLIYFGRLKNLSLKKAKIEAIRLIDRHGIIDSMEKAVSQVSREVQEKLQIIISIIHDPDVLILDEPFRGLHPLNQDMLRKMIYRFREEEKTIIIATSQFNEAEKICDEILFLKEGKTILKGNLDKLRKKFQAHLISVESDDNLAPLKSIKGVKRIFIDKQSAKLFVDSHIPKNEVIQKIISSVNVSRIEINRPNLDDIFYVVIHSKDSD